MTPIQAPYDVPDVNVWRPDDVIQAFRQIAERHYTLTNPEMTDTGVFSCTVLNEYDNLHCVMRIDVVGCAQRLVAERREALAREMSERRGIVETRERR